MKLSRVETASSFRAASALTYSVLAYLGVLFLVFVMGLEAISYPEVIAAYVSSGLLAAVFGWIFAPWHQAALKSFKLYAAPLLIVVASSLGAGITYTTTDVFLGDEYASFWAVVLSGAFVGAIGFVWVSPFSIFGCIAGVFCLRRLSLK